MAAPVEQPQQQVDEQREEQHHENELAHAPSVGRRPECRRGTAVYPGGVKEFAVYTLARLGVFAASYAVIIGIYLLVAGTGHVPVFWPLLVALVVSSVISVYLLRGLRNRFAAKVEQRAHNASRRFEEMRAREDVD